MLEIAQAGIAEAVRRGAIYVDVRLEDVDAEDIIIRDGKMLVNHRAREQGLGIRVLANGAWGFSAISEPNLHDVTVAARRAVELAKTAAIVQVQPVSLVHESPHCGIYRTRIDRNPLSVSLEEKLAFLSEIDGKVSSVEKIEQARLKFRATQRRKLFVNSEGSEISQDLVHVNLQLDLWASSLSTTLSLPTLNDTGFGLSASGWDKLDQKAIIAHAIDKASMLGESDIAEQEAIENTEIIFDAEATAALIAGTCGPAVELDGVLGAERSRDGQAFLTPDKLGSYAYASNLVNLYSDSTLEGAAGSFGFDDEGVEAQRVNLVENGRFAGYVCSRETARRMGLNRSTGGMRGASWRHLPIIRAANLGLEPGDAESLESMIADTKEGVLLEGPCLMSNDRGRDNFELVAVGGWKIENGQKVRRIKKPILRGDSSTFWQRCNAIGGQKTWRTFGQYASDKGRPQQSLQQAVGTGPTRFGPASVVTMNPQLELIDAMDDSIFVEKNEAQLSASEAVVPPVEHSQDTDIPSDGELATLKPDQENKEETE